MSDRPNLSSALQAAIATFLGAIVFYTSLPIPQQFPLAFHGVARWIVAVGWVVGGLTALWDWGLAAIGMPDLVRAVLDIGMWVALTGGLHLDGAMDTADGLAVMDPERRLTVMADSRTGAFGVMAALFLVTLKIAALASLTHHRWICILLAAGWGRWGQLLAIVQYPYLKAVGKGAMHKAAIQSRWEVLPSLIAMLGLGASVMAQFSLVLPAIGLSLGGMAISAIVGAWFYFKLGGHTGDTYGATVEWTEAFVLCLGTLVIA